MREIPIKERWTKYKEFNIECCKIAVNGKRKVCPVVMGYSISPDYDYKDDGRVFNPEFFYFHAYCRVYTGSKMQAFYGLDGFNEGGYVSDLLNLKIPEWVKDTYMYHALQHLRGRYAKHGFGQIYYDKMSPLDLEIIRSMLGERRDKGAHFLHKILPEEMFPWDEWNEEKQCWFTLKTQREL